MKNPSASDFLDQLRELRESAVTLGLSSCILELLIGQVEKAIQRDISLQELWPDAEFNEGGDFVIQKDRIGPEKLSPELLAWAKKQHSEEEILQGIQDIRKSGGHELSQFLMELEEEAGLNE